MKIKFQNVLKLVRRVEDNSNKAFKIVIGVKIGEDMPIRREAAVLTYDTEGRNLSQGGSFWLKGVELTWSSAKMSQCG